MKIVHAAISTALLFAVFGSEANAANKKNRATALAICSTQAGALVARPKCKKKDTQVTTIGLASLVPAIKGADGAQGPQGPTGAAGPAGVANLEYKSATTASGKIQPRTVIDIPIGSDIVIPASADVEVSCDGKDIVIGVRCEPTTLPAGLTAVQTISASGKSATCSYVNNSDAEIAVKAVAICAPGPVNFFNPIIDVPLVVSP